MILRIGLKEMETNRPWNWRVAVPNTTKMTLVRPLMTSLKTTVRAHCTVSARGPLPLSIKALARCLSGAGELIFGQGSVLSSCWHPKYSKLSFSTNLGSLLAFECQAARTPPFSNTVSRSVVPYSLRPHELQPTRLLCL